ncbi:MAG: caspase family protein [Pirellulales bacterium]
MCDRARFLARPIFNQSPRLKALPERCSGRPLTILSIATILLAATVLASPLTIVWGQAPQPNGPEVTRGLKKPTAVRGPLQPYRRTWALVIGIDYRERTDVERAHLPALRNAQRDATAVAETLRNLYGFDPVTLIGPDATAEAIAAELNKLRDPQQVQPEDGVFVYFSGHGVRTDVAAERGLIFPHDVVLNRGKPVEKYVRLHGDLVATLEQSPARQKLVVLDSCHSGEIFSRAARPASMLGGPVPPELIAEPVLQALASCRGAQVASDGVRGENSPFTAAFIRSLQRIPAREIGAQKSPITTSRLFVAMRSDLKSLRGGQSPDCRRLVNGDGDFLFWPRAAADFTPFADSVEDFELLQAMVPGEHGKWWFDETPWFIPGLRRMILEGKARQRGEARESAITRDSLAALAEAAVIEAEKVADPLIQLRVSQYRRLRGVAERGRLREEVAKIEAELAAIVANPAQGPAIEAPDLHLLAVVRHYLSLNGTSAARADVVAPPAQPIPDKDLPAKPAIANEETAASGNPMAAYTDALAAYADAEGRDRALAALCRCDLGNYLLDDRREWLRAAREFEAALAPFRDESEGMMAAVVAGEKTTFKEIPPAFHIHALCRQADAWQRQNRWGEADRCLDEALAVTQNFSSQHDLMALVQKRMAWSYMEQWRIDEAQRAFQESNRVLVSLAHERQTLPERPAGVVPSLAPPTADDSTRSQDFDRVLQHDYDDAIDYLHNQHGLAMASRFQGQVSEAAANYRWITGKLTLALSRLASEKTSSGAEVPTDVEPRLIERLINTQERLGDCNLFGDPAVRDVKEAADDYRRALGWIGRMPAGRRSVLRASLLFKQALALATPSSAQDVAHAEFLCQEAQDWLNQSTGATPPPLATLAALTPAIVRAYSTPQDEDRPSTDKAAQQSLSDLRQAIAAWSELDGQTLHRDQLELLLFASRILVERGDSLGKYQALRDTDHLLAFCRQTLSRGDVARSSAGGAYGDTLNLSGGREARTYLRPYYDSILRARLAGHPKQVKELLELQWEATRGAHYVKPEQSTTVLALYLLDGKGWLFLDVPQGASKAISLDGHCSLNDLRLACGTERPKLPLPIEVVKELAGLSAPPQGLNRGQGQAELELPVVECWWRDPVRGLGEGELRWTERSKSPSQGGASATPPSSGNESPAVGENESTAPLRVITRRPQLDDEFPFTLPENLRRRP